MQKDSGSKNSMPFLNFFAFKKKTLNLPFTNFEKFNNLMLKTNFW